MKINTLSMTSNQAGPHLWYQAPFSGSSPRSTEEEARRRTPCGTSGRSKCLWDLRSGHQRGTPRVRLGCPRRLIQNSFSFNSKKLFKQAGKTAPKYDAFLMVRIRHNFPGQFVVAHVMLAGGSMGSDVRILQFLARTAAHVVSSRHAITEKNCLFGICALKCLP